MISLWTAGAAAFALAVILSAAPADSTPAEPSVRDVEFTVRHTP